MLSTTTGRRWLQSPNVAKCLHCSLALTQHFLCEQTDMSKIKTTPVKSCSLDPLPTFLIWEFVNLLTASLVHLTHCRPSWYESLSTYWQHRQLVVCQGRPTASHKLLSQLPAADDVNRPMLLCCHLYSLRSSTHTTLNIKIIHNFLTYDKCCSLKSTMFV